MLQGSKGPTFAGHFGNPYLWTGQRYSPRTGLYHFIYRTYDQELGRWLQKDMLGALAADTPYRLFYAVDSPRVNNFVLFMVGTSPDYGFDVAAPTSGRWSSSDGFEFIDLEETARGPVRDPLLWSGSARARVFPHSCRAR